MKREGPITFSCKENSGSGILPVRRSHCGPPPRAGRKLPNAQLLAVARRVAHGRDARATHGRDDHATFSGAPRTKHMPLAWGGREV